MDLERLIAVLPPGLNLVRVDRVESTNEWASAIISRLASDAVPRSVVMADEQTVGKGRGTRSWTSPRGGGLWATWFGEVSEGGSASLPVRVGASLCRAIEGLGADGVGLKWPNDLVLVGPGPGARRKLGGVLCGSLLRRGRSVMLVGFGINFAQPEGDLAQSAVGLQQLGVAVDDSAVAALITAVDRAVDDGDGDWRQDQERYSAHHPGDILHWHDADAELEGTFLGFDADGRLRLEIDGTERVLASGDIS